MNNVQERVRENLKMLSHKIKKQKERVQTQITLSKSLLVTAQANETQKLAVVTQKGVEFAKANRDLASFSGVPAAREVLATRVAYCLYKLNEAKNNHAKAVKNRKNMQKKLDLNQKALKILEAQEQTLLVGKHQSNQINIYTTGAIRKISKIDSLQAQYRLTNDSRDLYSVKDISNQDLSASDLGVDLSVYNEIERQFLEESVFDVVDGKIVSKRNKIFDKNEKDGNNKSNLERMQEGNAPLCKDGMSMELHHLKQEDDGIIIELTRTEHKKYYKDLHLSKKESEINRSAFNAFRRNYYKKRAKELENETA
nr:HNH/ENDO VII family nuclease [Helicobacter pylori]